MIAPRHVLSATLALVASSFVAAAADQPPASGAPGVPAAAPDPSSTPTPASPQFAPLKWSFAPEQLLSYTLEFQVQRTRPGSVIDQTERYHLSLLVLSVDDAGTARVRVTFDRVEFRLLFNGNVAAETDTNKNAEPNGSGFDARINEFRGFAGRSITAQVSSSGVVSDVQGADALRSAIIQRLGERPPGDSVARVTRNTEPAAIADMLSVITRLAVPGARSIGQSAPPWDYSLSKFEVVPDPSSPAAVRSLATTDAGTEVIASWKTTFTPSPEAPPDAPAFGVSALTGSQTFAVDRGMVRSLECSATVEFETQVAAPPAKPATPGAPASAPATTAITEIMRSTSRVTLISAGSAAATSPDKAPADTPPSTPIKP